MAIVSINAITSHLSGALGDVVFRPYLGSLVAALRPKPTTIPPSEAQLARQVEFRKAVNYAMAVLGDPVRRQVYEAVAREKRKTIMALAVGDYFNPPTVTDISLAAFQGQVGNKIAILASDDVEVVSVGVVIRSNNDGVVLESGAAVRVNNEWLYTATTQLPLNTAATVEVTATDRPGHSEMQAKAFTRTA